jgi:hypothetical protein
MDFISNFNENFLIIIIVVILAIIAERKWPY